MRPAVDVVVPFAGSDAELARVVAAVRGLALRQGDTVAVVDNQRRAARPAGVLEAVAVRSSYHARNAGARAGSAPWLLFVDADVDLPADLLDRLFEPPPAEGTGVLAGGVRDAPGGGAAARYA